jgi:hypothetical protein
MAKNGSSVYHVAWGVDNRFCCKNLTSLAKGLVEPWVREG